MSSPSPQVRSDRARGLRRRCSADHAQRQFSAALMDPSRRARSESKSAPPDVLLDDRSAALATIVDSEADSAIAASSGGAVERERRGEEKASDRPQPPT